MKKFSILTVAALMLASCSDFTEIEPKGKNLLSTATQLEMLLNQEYMTITTDMKAIASDLAPAAQHIPTLIAAPNKTREAILISFDDARMDQLANLTPSDEDCINYYGYIGQVCNPILQKIDDAEGDAQTRNRIKCEALVLRAYFHYILVNKYAKAYQPGTAATLPGIPYMTETADITTAAQKVSVQEVYDRILADLDQAIALDALPTVAPNKMRISKPCAYAAKAMALMSMQRYAAADSAAREALALHDAIDDYNTMITTLRGMAGMPHDVFIRTQMQCREDLFYTYGVEGYPISTEAWEAFEPGSICRDNLITLDIAYDGITTSESILGVPYQMVMDSYSGWNGAGLKTVHLLLVRAECQLRNGNIDSAMELLDRIRVNRIRTDQFQALAGQVTTTDEAIRRLKQTSHGEHIFSIWNFINRKRWNQTDWRETFTRRIDDTEYSLSPDSRLWVFPFPQNVINNNPNITQNY